MINKFIDWYLSTRLMWRRIILAILAPACLFVTIEPLRLLVGVVAKLNRFLGIACLPILLLALAVSVVIVCLFVVEMLAGLGKKIENNVVRFAVVAVILIWLLIPVYLVKHFAKFWG